VELIRFRESRRAVAAFGSEGFELSRLIEARGATQVNVVELAPGGCIGRHPAAATQLLGVISGSAVVSGGDGAEHEIGPGDAVLWRCDEEHATRTREGLVGVIVETDEVVPASST